jgi:hypothetical protein
MTAAAAAAMMMMEPLAKQHARVHQALLLPWLLSA